MTDETCGYDLDDGSTCDLPASRDDGRCHHHTETGDRANGGRPSSFGEDTKEAIYAAVGSGLKVGHVAAAAGISAKTLRRWTCCIDDLSDAVPNDDPCDFCQGYAQAHANGARDVLDECRPEFRASASFGYNDTQQIDADHTHDFSDGWKFIDE